MPKYSATGPSLVDVFQALSDTTRLAVIERLSIGPASTTELARPFDMALPSFLQHLTALQKAGIVTSHKAGRSRVYQLVPDSLGEASRWLATNRSHWERRLDQLDQFLLPTPQPPSSTSTPEESI
jgi:DNA-binding transcriptional ArsR family regulator